MTLFGKKHTFLFVLIVVMSLSGCGFNSASPSDVIKKWNSSMSEGDADHAFGMFAQDATLIDSVSKSAPLKDADLKSQLKKFAGEFKKFKDAGKPLPKFEVLNENAGNDKSSVSVAYSLANGRRERIDFELIKEAGSWKIKQMDGYGFKFE